MEGAFASVVAARKANDHLSLKSNASAKKMLAKYDKTGAAVITAKTAVLLRLVARPVCLSSRKKNL